MRGLRSLSLGKCRISDLGPLAALSRLETLSLNDTPVSDLRPLARLTALSGLSIHRTQVHDLRPLRDLPLNGGASDVLGLPGLHFRDIPACRNDPELERLSRIADWRQATRETLAYLGTLPP